jgi:hypothetical protein
LVGYAILQGAMALAVMPDANSSGAVSPPSVLDPCAAAVRSFQITLQFDVHLMNSLARSQMTFWFFLLNLMKPGMIFIGGVYCLVLLK